MSSLSRSTVLNTIHNNVEKNHLPRDAVRRSVPDVLRGFGLLRSKGLGGTSTILFKRSFCRCPRYLLHLTEFGNAAGSRFISGRHVVNGICRLLSRTVTFFFGRLSLSKGIRKLCERRRLDVPCGTLERYYVGTFYRETCRHFNDSMKVTVCSSEIRVRGDNAFPPSVAVRGLLNNRGSRPRGLVVTGILCGDTILRD